MPDNPKDKPDTSKPLEYEDQAAVERRVDKMLDPKLPDTPPAPAIPPAPAASPVEPPKPAEPADKLPPLDIFKDTQTAPPLPADNEAPVKKTKITVKTGEPEPPNKPEKTPEEPPMDKPIVNPKEAVEEQPSQPATEESEEPQANEYDDPKTQKAVDEITRQESDAALAATDIEAAKAAGGHKKHGGRLKRFFKSKKVWLLVVVLLVVAALAVPFTRYKILGLFVKESYSVVVKDSKTSTPVSGATVTLDGKSTETNSNGKATIKVPVGYRQLSIQKQYYKNYSSKVLVTLKNSSNSLNIKLDATGRQVPIKVINKITGQPVANASIRVLDTKAQTNAKGMATIVLPTTASTQKATVELKGYNTLATKIEVTSKAVAANTFAITPAGQVYFLSNLSGNIDVVKANLDGSGRHMVLAGTGNEDSRTTILLASRDWKYLALLSKRDGGPFAKLFLIDTATDKVTTVDQSMADFSLIGWYGHDFVYDIAKVDVFKWQNGHEQLKSYNADQAKATVLDQTEGTGKASSYAYQSFYNFNETGGKVIYAAQWYSISNSGAGPSLSGKKNSIRSVQAGGGKTDLQTFSATATGYIQSVAAGPGQLYFAVDNYDKNTTMYYQYNNGNLQPTAGINQQTFDNTYPTYLFSPSSNQTFWAEQRDGKNTLFVGDQNGQNKKQIATLSDYRPYGWYSDKYLLVSKNDSELYIMPAAGSKNGQKTLKITDYYKPQVAISGYGYGYGGL